MATTKAITSCMEALTREYRTITNNLANANTPAYKRKRTSFEQLMDNAYADEGGATEVDSSIATRSAVDFTPAALNATGRTLDLAIEGEGFFALETPQGMLYTRGGKFRADAEGQLVDPAGRLVAGQNGPITIPRTVSTADVSISRDGTVQAGGRSLGRLRVVTFANPGVLHPTGGGCYSAPSASRPEDVEDPRVHQGYVESSNVSVVEELVSLITVSRLYEANLKSVRMQDEKTQNLLRVVST